MTKNTPKKKIESTKNTANVTDPSTWNFATKCLQAGWKPKIGEPRVLPIFQSTTYKYEDVDEVERLFEQYPAQAPGGRAALGAEAT